MTIKRWTSIEFKRKITCVFHRTLTILLCQCHYLRKSERFWIGFDPALWVTTDFLKLGTSRNEWGLEMDLTLKYLCWLKKIFFSAVNAALMLWFSTAWCRNTFGRYDSGSHRPPPQICESQKKERTEKPLGPEGGERGALQKKCIYNSKIRARTQN